MSNRSAAGGTRIANWGCQLALAVRTHCLMASLRHLGWLTLCFPHQTAIVLLPAGDKATSRKGTQFVPSAAGRFGVPNVVQALGTGTPCVTCP